MDGIFLKKKTALFANILGIVAGTFLILLFTFLMFADSETTTNADTLLGSIIAICFGVVIIALCIFLMLFNHGAYLTITENHVEAKFNRNQKIICFYSEIAFVDSNLFSLFIKLKSGKQYTILNLQNAEQICDAIRKKTYTGTDTLICKENLFSEIKFLIEKRNRKIVLLIALAIFMFLNIFLCVFLTNGKELSDFSYSDWIYFVFFVVTECCAVIVLCYVANQAGKTLPVLHEKKASLRKLILETAPLLSGNLLGAYMDSTYQIRVTVFGYPNMEDVYFCVEKVDKNYNLICIFQSPIVSNIEEIKPMLDEFIKIG